jgi:hypothetical protein
LLLVSYCHHFGPSDDVDANTRLIVEEILFRTEHETLQKIYNLPHFGSTLEFLTMFALSSGRLLKVRLKTNIHFLPFLITSHHYRAVLPISLVQRAKFSQTGTTRKFHTSRSHLLFTHHPCHLSCLIRERPWSLLELKQSDKRRF